MGGAGMASSSSDAELEGLDALEEDSFKDDPPSRGRDGPRDSFKERSFASDGSSSGVTPEPSVTEKFNDILGTVNQRLGLKEMP